MITELKPGGYFVFGSNLSGIHGAGAARQARDNFGAKFGKGEGITGKSYAFPTLGYNLEKLPECRLELSRDRLYEACRDNPNKRFLLTKVGCGLAGYPEDQMRGLFKDPPENLG